MQHYSFPSIGDDLNMNDQVTEIRRASAAHMRAVRVCKRYPSDKEAKARRDRLRHKLAELVIKRELDLIRDRLGEFTAEDRLAILQAVLPGSVTR